MNIKIKLLKSLESDEEEYISGAALAAKLSVSRNAIWKAVEGLRADGYEIEAITNKGYRLISRGDVLTVPGLMSCVKKDVFTFELRKTVTSTNTVLRELAATKTEKYPEGYVLVAEQQTAGKGRLGRTFHSPANHGVYFSLLLHPGEKSVNAPLITAAAAVAAAKAIEDIIGVKVGIKWVNDLFYGDKKVCGILTEASFAVESGMIESAVLGIGINITSPKEGFPEEISQVATALQSTDCAVDNQRSRLIGRTLDYFWDYYENLAGREFLNEYRQKSIVLGRDINVISFDNSTPAKALEIDDDCGLIVRLENGEIKRLNSGEVSIRL